MLRLARVKRLDFNLTPKHHLETSYWYNRYNTYPDTLNNADQTFPGFPQVAGQNSDRFSYAAALRSTLSSRLVNEFRSGFTGGTVRFSPERSLKDFVGPVANQAGFLLNLSSTSALANASLGYSNAASSSTLSRRNAPITFFGDMLNWQKGAHNLSFGGSWTQAKVFLYQRTIVPTITFGVDSNDPANSMFTAANFQGAAAADLNRARAHYATLTGRVVQISGSATIDGKTGEYVYLGRDIERSRREMPLLTQKPQWARLQAVRSGRVYLTDGNQYFNRPGPRLVESLEILADLLHPSVYDFGHEGTGWQRLD